jgi:general secretion pathway protein G
MSLKKMIVVALAIIGAIVALRLTILPPDKGSEYPVWIVCQGDLLMLHGDIEWYKERMGHYPSNEEGFSVLAKPPNDPVDRERWVQRSDSEKMDPWGHPYQYRIPGRQVCAPFEIFSLGPDGIVSWDDVYEIPAR